MNRRGGVSSSAGKHAPRASASVGGGAVALRIDWRFTAPEVFLDAWRDAEMDAGDALQAWLRAGPDDREDAFVVYLAALEREQHAADVLALATAVRG